MNPEEPSRESGGDGDSEATALELRPYQLEARCRILAELERVRATLLVLATGLGKTVCFASVAQHFVERGHRVLVIAHRSELLDQAAVTLTRFGLTVGIEQAERRARDASVVIASVQTLRGKRLASFATNSFGLVIIDEAHHTAAKGYRAVLDHFNVARVLGVTATPDRTDGLALRHAFTSVAYRMELGAGIHAGWLAPIDLRSVMVNSLDLSRVRSAAGDLVASELEAELTRDRVLHEVAGPLSELAAKRQTLAFVAGVHQAHALAEVLGGYGVSAAAVDGSMSGERRAEVLADYRAGRVNVICNAMLLTEGFDCPETACIALVRPTRSRSLLTQMIGRGTRPAVGKLECLVIDFVPGRAATIRLASPADALAGRDLPRPLLDRVRAQSLNASGNLCRLIDRAKAAEDARQKARMSAKRCIRMVDVAYAASRLDINELLEAVTVATPPHRGRGASSTPQRRASAAQIHALRRTGLEVPDHLTIRQASLLLNVLARRRALGLCTVKQSRLLRSYGLRDDLSFEQARKVLNVIAHNGWDPPAWLYVPPLIPP